MNKIPPPSNQQTTRINPSIATMMTEQHEPLAEDAVKQGRREFFLGLMISLLIAIGCSVVIVTIFGMPLDASNPDTEDQAGHPIIVGFTRFSAAVAASPTATLAAMSIVAAIGVAATVARSSRDRELAQLNEEVEGTLNSNHLRREPRTIDTTKSSRIIELTSAASTLFFFSTATAGLAIITLVALFSHGSTVEGLATLTAACFLILESSRSKYSAHIADELFDTYTSSRFRKRIRQLASTPRHKRTSPIIWWSLLTATLITHFVGSLIMSHDAGTATAHVAVTSGVTLAILLMIDASARISFVRNRADAVAIFATNCAISVILAMPPIVLFDSIGHKSDPPLIAYFSVIIALSLVTLALFRGAGHAGWGPCRSVTLPLIRDSVQKQHPADSTLSTGVPTWLTTTACAAMTTIIAVLPLAIFSQFSDLARAGFFAGATVFALLPRIGLHPAFWVLAIAPASQLAIIHCETLGLYEHRTAPILVTVLCALVWLTFLLALAWPAPSRPKFFRTIQEKFRAGPIDLNRRNIKTVRQKLALHERECRRGRKPPASRRLRAM